MSIKEGSNSKSCDRNGELSVEIALLHYAPTYKHLCGTAYEVGAMASRWTLASVPNSKHYEKKSWILRFETECDMFEHLLATFDDNVESKTDETLFVLSLFCDVTANYNECFIK